MLLGFTAVVIVVASALWIHDHPYAVQWDEASYFNLSVLNLGRLHSGNLRQTVGVILGSGDSSRPPAYRILVLPFLWLFGPNLAAARLLSLLLSGASAGFLYAATCRVAGRAAGAFALLIFLLSPEVVAASIFFSTEAPFYLATAAMLYFIFTLWSDGRETPVRWIGLGLAVGLGFLSKTSFIMIAGPLLLFVLIDSLRPQTPFSQSGVLVQSRRSRFCGGGFLVAAICRAGSALREVCPGLDSQLPWNPLTHHLGQVA